MPRPILRDGRPSKQPQPTLSCGNTTPARFIGLPVAAFTCSPLINSAVLSRSWANGQCTTRKDKRKPLRPKFSPQSISFKKVNGDCLLQDLEKLSRVGRLTLPSRSPVRVTAAEQVVCEQL